MQKERADKCCFPTGAESRRSLNCINVRAARIEKDKKGAGRRAQPAAGSSHEQQFDWPLAYEAETWLRERIGAFLESNRSAHRLAERMRGETGTDFFEWIDHVVVWPTE